ncbi:MAG TPA: hypothetical protein DDY14_13060, partial [Chromatiaceae bacterium]|nr:MAG: hypothetical protein N838_12040 [Thiohalocapsa sp. PB-PSB1]HBG96210.1 hypothetical protein [Chromatiaceae bacterium]
MPITRVAAIPLLRANENHQRNKPMRRSTQSINAAALLGGACIVTVLAGAPRQATAAIFDVTQNTWGTTADVGSFAWAIDQANTRVSKS